MTNRHPVGIRSSLIESLTHAARVSLFPDKASLLAALERSGLAASVPFTPDAETASPAEIAAAGTDVFSLTAEGWLTLDRLLRDQAADKPLARLLKWLATYLIPTIVGWVFGVITPYLDDIVRKLFT